VADEANAEMVAAVTGALGRRHLVVSVWLRDPSVTDLLSAPAKSVADLYQRAAAAQLVGWRERSLASLRGKGALVVDCPPGQLTPGLLSKYVEIKARRLL
jgi:uncharacterized protein (DUF58 family)